MSVCCHPLLETPLSDGLDTSCRRAYRLYWLTKNLSNFYIKLFKYFIVSELNSDGRLVLRLTFT